MQFSIGIQGTEKLISILNKLVPALDPIAICDEAAAILLARNMARYLKEQAPDGTPWPVSLAATRRAAKGVGGGTLYDTGLLYRSIQLGAGEAYIGGEVGTREITALAEKNGVRYGGYHFFGIDQEQRVFLGVGPDDRDPIVNMVIHRIAEALGG